MLITGKSDGFYARWSATKQCYFIYNKAGKYIKTVFRLSDVQTYIN